LVATTATGSAVTQVGDYIFRACYTDKQQGEVGAKFAFERLKARNAASIFVKYFTLTPHQSTAGNISAKFSSLGGKVVTDYFGIDGKDSDHVLDSLLSAKPDLLYIATPGDEAANVAKQAREKGFKGPILGMDDWDMPQLIKQGGSAVEGSYFTNHFSTGDPRPEVQGFVKKYHDRFGVDPDVLAVLAYDASRLLFDSIRRAGSTDGSAVRDALKAADFPAITGRVKFDDSRNPAKPVVIIQVQSGKLAYNSTMNP
jgi:branched-chain amino acid transport system substrate-binding protein